MSPTDSSQRPDHASHAARLAIVLALLSTLSTSAYLTIGRSSSVKHVSIADSQGGLVSLIFLLHGAF